MHVEKLHQLANGRDGAKIPLTPHLSLLRKENERAAPALPPCNHSISKKGSKWWWDLTLLTSLLSIYKCVLTHAII